jgi:general secretion pathway protein E
MLEQQATKLLPFEFARVNRVLIDNERQQLLIGPAAPLWAVAEVNRISGQLPISNLTETEFGALLSEIYSGRSGTSEAVMEDIKDFVDMESAAADLEEVSDLLDAENDDAPIVRLLNAILTESLKENASDIHIEPYEREALVRFRLDGVLRTVLSPSVQIAPLLISRIKVMSKLDIAEKRLPQDGRMSVLLGGRSIDLRVSTMPSSHGERVVMRLLDKDAGKLQAQQLGMPEATKNELDELISRPHGIILVTGPTGSGKTTTLYAALQQMDRKQRNIMTVEDPVEYDLPGVSQTQINLRAGMTFARGLRAILRQDPDVILIGEIRDGETAEIATQASLTGHLVLSTLHTNTAAGAVTRLQDLGVDSFLLASTVRGIISQRLMRKLCTHCREEVVVDDYQRSLLNVPKDFSIYKSKGCEACNNTGFSGRQALFELVTVDASLQSLIHEDSGELELEQAIRKTVPSIREAGFELVRQGKTTIEEVIRVTSV